MHMCPLGSSRVRTILESLSNMRPNPNNNCGLSIDCQLSAGKVLLHTLGGKKGVHGPPIGSDTIFYGGGHWYGVPKTHFFAHSAKLS